MVSSMRKYELLLTLPGTLDENEASAQANEIANMVKEYDTNAELHTLGKIRLAYPIKQIRYGYFYTVVFAAQPAQVIALQKKLTVNREVLRYMVSHYNTSLTTTQKIVYNTNEMGVTTMRERAEPVKIERKASPSKTLDLAEIGKKLDEILDNGVIGEV